MADEASPALRRGWTTGTCATAAAGAAFQALIEGDFPDPVTVTLPNGQTTAFSLAETARGADFARASVVKDAGDDPDVTHGAVVTATVRLASAGDGVRFVAGPGVGTVTRPGLALPPGEPAINPVPRSMITAALGIIGHRNGVPLDVVVEIAIPGGEDLAKRTLNGRLGIVGGLSILGTTGIVVPYSCAAWIDTIHRGVDVARAMGLDHVAGATGATSEAAVRRHYAMPDPALIDMGDFVGAMLKYLRRHPVARVTVAGGVAKMCKLGQGLLDLHSKRGAVDRDWLVSLAGPAGASSHDFALIRQANTVAQIFEETPHLPLGSLIARAAWATAAQALGSGTDLDVMIIDRAGTIVTRGEVRRT